MKEGLDLMREKFPDNQILKLPKPTKKQTELVKQDFKNGIRCEECGGWHHKDVVHLDYVGHAALTDRLLECDINWSWKPVAFDDKGNPAFDNIGGLWIHLTVCGVTRLGYGHPDGKQGGNAIKEAIGDALRNAAMRFGAALDLWHKGDLHIDDDNNHSAQPHVNNTQNTLEPVKSETEEERAYAWAAKAETWIKNIATITALDHWQETNKKTLDIVCEYPPIKNALTACIDGQYTKIEKLGA